MCAVGGHSLPSVQSFSLDHCLYSLSLRLSASHCLFSSLQTADPQPTPVAAPQQQQPLAQNQNTPRDAEAELLRRVRLLARMHTTLYIM